MGYKKAFAEAWPEEPISREPLEKLNWFHNLTLLEEVKAERLWYARAAVENGWSRNSNDVAFAPIRSCPAGIKRPVQLRFPDAGRGRQGERNRAGPDHASPEVPDSAGHARRFSNRAVWEVGPAFLDVDTRYLVRQKKPMEYKTPSTRTYATLLASIK